jgi:hypothetical protein
VRRASATQVLEAAVQPQQAANQPHVIHPTAVYSVEDARQILKLQKSTIRRELREGRIRVAKRAGRYFLLGEWLLEWLRAGELKRRRPLAPSTNGTKHNGALADSEISVGGSSRSA